MQVSLREILPSDCLEIAEMERACFALPWSENDVRSVCNRSDFCGMLLQVDGKNVGYLLGLALFENAEVLRVAVLPDYRGQKLGGMVLDAFCDCVRARGAERVLLEVRSSNQPAICLYERRKFVRGRVRKQYYENGESAVEMCKEL